VHVCFYAAPFGVTPIELDEVYPLSQHETAVPLEQETVNYVATQAADYIERSRYEIVVFLHDPQNWNNTVKKACRTACKHTEAKFENVNLTGDVGKKILTRLEMILKKNLSEKP